MASCSLPVTPRPQGGFEKTSASTQVTWFSDLTHPRCLTTPPAPGNATYRHNPRANVTDTTSSSASNSPHHPWGSFGSTTSTICSTRRHGSEALPADTSRRELSLIFIAIRQAEAPNRFDTRSSDHLTIGTVCFPAQQPATKIFNTSMGKPGILRMFTFPGLRKHRIGKPHHR